MSTQLTKAGPMVFSTSVEVFLAQWLVILVSFRLLHVRGGVSSFTLAPPPSTLSSPRSWRCFQNSLILGEDCNVFSTSVEVFLRSGISKLKQIGLLHVRGGVSEYWKEIVGLAVVFSTSVEVFPRKA